MLKLAAAEGGQKRSNLIASEGQKTVAQLQSERAAQQMQYYQTLPGVQGAQGQVGTKQQGATAVAHGPAVPSRSHQERPRKSPPTVGSLPAGNSRTGSTQQPANASRSASHSHQGVKTAAGSTRTVSNAQTTVQTSSMAIAGARTKTSAQLVAGSPPPVEQLSASLISPRSRGQSGSPVAMSAEGSTIDGHSNGQTAVNSSSSTAAVPQRSNLSNAPPPGQQVVKKGSSHKNTNNKRLSAHIPLTAHQAFDFRLHSQKPRRYSDSDHNPDRPRLVVTRAAALQPASTGTTTSQHSSSTQGLKHANNAQCSVVTPVTPPIVPVRDAASMSPSSMLAAATNVNKIEKVGLLCNGCCM